MSLRLTALPSEIRTAIFEHALRPVRANDIRTVASSNLLATSRQIYNEACLLPFRSNDVSLPTITDSSTSATLRLLQRLSTKQLNAIRRLTLHVVGSTLDAVAAAKVLRTLRLGPDQCNGTIDSAATSLPKNAGDLRELNLVVSARDVAIPLADCRVGLQQALDTITSPLFTWTESLDKLRKLRLRVRVLRDEQFPKIMREELQTALTTRLGQQVHIEVECEAVQTTDCCFDGLDVDYPGSFVGILGNVCAVPMEFQHAYSGIEWAYG